MFEYWIYEDVKSDIKSVLPIISKDGLEGIVGNNGDTIWCFQGRNVFVIQSCYPFGDGNILLDELLQLLSKKYPIYDKGIIKSYWKPSSS